MLSDIRFYAKNQRQRYHTPYQFCWVPSIKEKEEGIRDRAGFYTTIIDDVGDDVGDNVKK